MKRQLRLPGWALVLSILAGVGCGELPVEGTDASASDVPFFEPALCGATLDGPELKPHLTEADLEYFARLEALDPATLPENYDLREVFDLDLSLIGYMLDRKDVTSLNRDDLLLLGNMGSAVLLALGENATPTLVDYKELRRGLYHFYYCYRGLPATLDGFKAAFGDYTQWQYFIFDDSFPKIYPRKIITNPDLGVYVAETLRDGLIHETEIILDGYREDGMLEFMAFMPNGNISSRGEFRAGRDFAVGTSPYSCMSCHYNPDEITYDVIIPQMNRN